MKEWEKRELYKKYAGICLLEDEYNNLVDNGIIPQSLYIYYIGSYKIGLFEEKMLAASVTKEICDSGTKLFLEDWQYEYADDHTAAFFFDDFLVIIAEPSINSEHTFNKAPDVLPVAIPICNIKSYQIKYDELTLKFTNGATYCAYLQKDRYNHWLVKSLNFSYYINDMLLGGFSLSIEDKSSNFDKISGRLDLLMDNCCRDYIERALTISSLFTDPDIIAQLQKIVYLDKKGFLEGILCYKGSVSDTDFPEVIEKLDEIQGVKRILKEKNDECKIFISKLSDKKTELSNTPFFQKRNIKKEVRELEEEIRKMNDEISELTISLSNNKEASYDAIMKAILKAESENEVTNSECGLPDFVASEAKNIYLMCKERNLIKLKTEDEKKIFALICDNKKIPKQYQDIKLFNYGKQEVLEEESKEEIKTNYEKYRQSRTLNTVEFNEEKEKAEIVGKDKYIRKAIREQEIANHKAIIMEKVSDLAEKAAYSQSRTVAVKSDAAILGGLANGIAGPAMGLITYANIEQENARAEESAAEARRQGLDKLSKVSEYRALAPNYTGEAYRIGRRIEEINSRICDIEDSLEYFSYLKCCVESYKVDFDGTMSINIKVRFAKQPKINGTPIAIDGSLRVDVKDNDDKVGEAYLCAPGFDKTDLSMVGFNVQNKYSVIAIPSNSDFDVNKKYTFDIKPIHVWMIEK